MIWGKVQEIIKQAFVFLVVGMVAFSSFADPASAGSSQGNRQTGVTWLLYHQADEYTTTKKELILMLSLFQEKIIPIKSTNKYRLNQAVITLCMLGTVLRWAFFGKDEQSVCLKKAVRKWGDSVMIDHIFIFSLLMIWIMLLYHVILAMSGYRYEKKLYKLGKTLRFPEHPPFVSVLVPAHNEEKVIERTVKALCSFDYPEEFFEVIVINDCSTDRTGEILDRLAKRYPMLRPLHIHPPEGGTGKSAALNNGLRHARGEVLAVYDADNTPERTALRRLVATLVSDPDYGVAVGKFRVINAKKTLLTRFINIETINFFNGWCREDAGVFLEWPAFPELIL